MTARWSAVLTAIALTTGANAQQAPRFEVASIKVNKSGDGEDFLASPGNRFEWTAVTLRQLAARAYQRSFNDEPEVVGGPDWIDRERFDVLVQAPIDTPALNPDGTPGPLLAMMRSLLEERFQLAARWERRDRPLYSLVVARKDGRLGPNIARVDVNCTAALNAQTRGGRPAQRAGRGPDCSFRGGGMIQGNAVTMDMFARTLRSWTLDREVVDKTGLTGTFDLDLRFAPEPARPSGRRGGGPPEPAPVVSDAPSIFTALQEQLGLKLEAGRGLVDVLVIDRAERPTED
jgi:uncharacterized protein (TIGR03435 family)